ncbi:MAG: endopeptidase La [Patescibacteria group bacterium]|nr:endopeptidase La [Patescibacteria group bacterium]
MADNDQINQAAEVYRELFGGAESAEVPLIALRDTVVFPRVALPIIVKRAKSLAALESALKKNRLLVLVAQKNEATEDVGPDDVYHVGALVRVRESAKQPDGSVRLVADGVARVRVRDFPSVEPCLLARISPFPEPAVPKNERLEALMYSALNQFRRLVNMGAAVPFDVLLVILNVTDPWLLGDLIAANLDLKVADKQEILEAADIEAKLDAVGRLLGRQIRLLQMASKIQADTGKELDKMQREVFLREQLKAVEKELETLGARPENDDLKTKLDAAALPPIVREKANKEYERFKGMPPYSPEISYVRTYLEWLADLPWAKADEPSVDLKRAARVLEEDHYGLAKVKERILEYLAVHKLAGKIRGPILCFVGPPGTGKTSLGQSIARALGRKFHRVSLGGIRDEAEIRGHRRTYVGALPGRIIQGLASVKTRNPVFMLDEIDKVGADFRGDPSAALLEALDSEQNSAFSDHYLEVPYDLSDVMFITTANNLDTIPPALRDRLEVIEFPGYTEEEKADIAKRHLLKKTLAASGLKPASVRFDDAALQVIIRRYTSEAGVRNLERCLAAVCRKLARALAEGRRSAKVVHAADVPKLLGPEKYSLDLAEKEDLTGAATGLAWTEAGGVVLQIEATRMAGTGKLTLTGHLGQVMQESAQAALSYVRASAERFGIKPETFKESDIHLHVPSGATPKDGPSAGVAMATALVSLLTGTKVRRNVGMTGEITLRGRVLEIGGVKEKVLAARRAGLDTVIMPTTNRKDIVDVPEAARRDLKFVFATSADDVLTAALDRPQALGIVRPRQGGGRGVPAKHGSKIRKTTGHRRATRR